MSDERQQAKSGGGNFRSSENAAPPSPSQPLADRLECPICMLILPLYPNESFYESCCGKIVCCGCIIADARARAKRDSENSELVILESQPCAFCRAEPPADDKERVLRLCHRIDSNDDVNAMCQMGHYYSDGRMGLPKSREKALEMFKRAFELGSPEAAFCLAYMFDSGAAGAEMDKKKAREYTEEAVRPAGRC